MGGEQDPRGGASYVMVEAKNSASILAINGGSSSIRFALYEAGDPGGRLFEGMMERVGQPGTTLTVNAPAGKPTGGRPVPTSDPGATIHYFVNQLEALPNFRAVAAVGHRIVHGMAHTEPERITPELLRELKHIVPYDPDHLPIEIALIEAIRERHPDLPQVACFDTAFHRAMPRVAKLLPLPRRYDAQGIQRYGFHGISYSYLLEELLRLGDPAATKGRVILAHLGSGASMAAVRDGKSIDTSMSFTATAGLVMSTRTGDLDPGLIAYLMDTERMPTKQLQRLVNHESGLLGVSETSSDMRDLVRSEADDARAAEAVELFCYQAKKWIGSYAAALGGLDTLVFAGGIGENSPPVRERICAGLQFLGIHLEDASNAGGESRISKADAPVTVRVIRTDEELMIARSVSRLLDLAGRP